MVFLLRQELLKYSSENRFLYPIPQSEESIHKYQKPLDVLFYALLLWISRKGKQNEKEQRNEKDVTG